MLLRYPTFSKDQVIQLIAMYRYRLIRRSQEKLNELLKDGQQVGTEDIITSFVDVMDVDEELRDLLGYWRRLIKGGLEAIQFSCNQVLYTALYELANADYAGFKGTSESTQNFIAKLVEAQPGIIQALEGAPMADPEYLRTGAKPALPAGKETATLN